MDRCIEDARRRPHPTIMGKTVWQVFKEEQPFLMAYRGPFDGFHAVEAAVIPTPEGLQLRHPPVVDCHRYDRLREAGHGTS